MKTRYRVSGRRAEAGRRPLLRGRGRVAECRWKMKHQASKLQAPEKLQASSSKLRGGAHGVTRHTIVGWRYAGRKYSGTTVHAAAPEDGRGPGAVHNMYSVIGFPKPAADGLARSLPRVPPSRAFGFAHSSVISAISSRFHMVRKFCRFCRFWTGMSARVKGE